MFKCHIINERVRLAAPEPTDLRGIPRSGTSRHHAPLAVMY